MLPFLDRNQVEAYNRYAMNHNASEAAGNAGVGALIFGFFVLACVCMFVFEWGEGALGCIVLGVILGFFNKIHNPMDHVPGDHNHH